MKLLTRGAASTTEPTIEQPAGETRGGGAAGRISTWRSRGKNTGPAMGWSRGASLSAGVCRLLIIGALICGPLALVGQYTSAGSRTAPRTAAPASTVSSADVAAAGEWATSFVVAWLTTPAESAQSLTYYLPAAANAQLQRVPRQVANPAVAAITKVSTQQVTSATGRASSSSSSAGTSVTSEASAPAGAPSDASSGGATAAAGSAWAVTVGLDVQEPTPAPVPAGGAATQTVRRYYAVSVWEQHQEGRTTLRALTLPAPVAAPVAGTGAELAYANDVSLTGGVAGSVTGFLSAYLAEGADTGGGDDLARWLSPSLTLTPVAPAAYAGVELRDLSAVAGDLAVDQPADGAQLRVLATARLVGLDQQTSTAQYALTLTGRGGRWEVSDLDPAPQLELPVASTSPPTSGAAGVSPSASSSTPGGGS